VRGNEVLPPTVRRMAVGDFDMAVTMGKRGLHGGIRGGASRPAPPSGYPVIANRRAGQLIRAQNRHNLRPAHIHFLIHKAGFMTRVLQLCTADAPTLVTDVQFAVTAALIKHQQGWAERPQCYSLRALAPHYIASRSSRERVLIKARKVSNAFRVA